MTIKRAGNFKAYAGLVERVKNAIFTPQQVTCSMLCFASFRLRSWLIVVCVSAAGHHEPAKEGRVSPRRQGRLQAHASAGHAERRMFSQLNCSKAAVSSCLCFCYSRCRWRTRTMRALTTLRTRM
jgi:hypothetical protein